MDFWEELKQSCELGVDKPRETRLCKEDWVTLTHLIIKEQKYRRELEDSIKKTAEKFAHPLDFLGLPYDASVMESVIVSLLGDDGEYLIWECDGNLETFNKRVTNPDGSHPNIKSLEEYYDKEVKKG